IVDGLIEHGYLVHYIAPTNGDEVQNMPRALSRQLAPHHDFVYPRELNYFLYDAHACRWARAQRPAPRQAFVYHRMSLLSVAAIELSRRTKLPLVVEYNGSEVWM